MASFSKQKADLSCSAFFNAATASASRPRARPMRTAKAAKSGWRLFKPLGTGALSASAAASVCAIWERPASRAARISSVKAPSVKIPAQRAGLWDWASIRGQVTARARWLTLDISTALCRSTLAGCPQVRSSQLFECLFDMASNASAAILILTFTAMRGAVVGAVFDR